MSAHPPSGFSSSPDSPSPSWPASGLPGAYRCECGGECHGGSTATEPEELPSDGTQGGFDPALGLPLVSGIGLPPQAGARLPLDTGLVYDPTGGAAGAGFGGSWLCGGLAGLVGPSGSAPASAPVYYRGPNRAVAFDLNVTDLSYITRYFSLQPLTWIGGGSWSSESSSSDSSSSPSESSPSESSPGSGSSCVDATHQYDALTRRVVTATAAGTREFYFNNQWRPIEERVSGAVAAQYVWNPADRWDLIRRRRPVAGAPDEIRFVLRDHLDPAAIINESGVVTERFRYDAFGPATILAPDFSARAASGCAWNFLYHAEFIDAETGLYNYGFRYYHPDLGRWISRDPIGEEGGLNLYAFVGNCGLDLVDRFGMEENMSSQGQSGKCVCGPDVTEAIQATLRNIENTFDSLSRDERKRVCGDFISPKGWDIHAFHNYYKQGDRILKESVPVPNLCGHRDADNNWRCRLGVTINRECHYAGNVNYIIFGHVGKICGMRYGGLRNIVLGWKIATNGGTPWPHASYGNALQWMEAGWAGWLPDTEYYSRLFRPVSTEPTFTTPRPAPNQMAPRGDPAYKGCSPCNKSIGPRVLRWTVGGLTFGGLLSDDPISGIKPDSEIQEMMTRQHVLRDPDGR